MDEKDCNLVVISDLHLSEGRSNETKQFSKHEDFFFDESFYRFLVYLNRKSQDYQKKWRLIINGDMIDFLQIAPPAKNEPIDFDVSEREKKFGLGTEAAKTVWKLKKIMNGHWRFFEALANFLNQDHHVVIIPGNHDIEFVYADIHQAFRNELRNYLTEKPASSNFVSNLEFLPWFYHEPGLVFIEHGHQYDPLNSFDFYLCPFRTVADKVMLDLPSGSFFVRYFFNQIENLNPFADNIKPVSKYMRWALRNQFSSLIYKGILWNYGLFLVEALKKMKPLGAQAKQELAERQSDLINALAQRSGLPVEKLQAIRKLWVPSSISNDSLLKVFLKFCSYEKISPYPGRARKIQDLLGVKYIVFGHTHDPDLRGLPSDSERKGEYVNSGTWTKVFSEDERLLREEKELVYVQILKRDEPKMELLKWKDELGEGERVNLFEN